MSDTHLPVVANSAREIQQRNVQVLQIRVANHPYCVAIQQLQDIVQFDSFYKIPTSTDEILGVVNIRGRIVTVLDLHRIFSEGQKVAPREKPDKYTVMTVSYLDDVIALLVDSVGDVLDIPLLSIRRLTEEKDMLVQLFCSGLAEINNQLIMVIDTNRIIKQFAVDKRSASIFTSGNFGIDINLFDNPV